MKRRKVLLSSILAVFLGSLVLGILFFSIPLVVFVEPNVPETFGSRLLPGVGVGEGFWYLPMKESNLRKLSAVRKPNLVVYTPLSTPDASLGKTLQWGRLDSEAQLVMPIQDDALWRDALKALGDKPVAIFYNLFDTKSREFYQSLQEDYPNLAGIPYEGFVSSFSLDNYTSDMDNFYAVLFVSPEETTEVYRATTSRVVMDFRYAASAVSLERVISVVPHWKNILKKALKMESGEISPDYTITVLGK